MNGEQRMVTAVLAGLLSMVGTAAGAQQRCTVPPELKGFAHPVSVATGAPLIPGRAVRVALTRDARLPVTPEKAPGAGTYAGSFALTVATPGRYGVALDGPAWIDVVRGQDRLASAEHGHPAACSGARKLVGYDLTPGRYLVQLSGARAAAATVMIVHAATAR